MLSEGYSKLVSKLVWLEICEEDWQAHPTQGFDIEPEGQSIVTEIKEILDKYYPAARLTPQRRRR